MSDRATAMNPRIDHILKNTSLLVLGLLFLPLSLYVLFISYAIQILVPQNGLRKRTLRSQAFKPKTVLVTGVGMAKGLRIARAFYETGHRVIGADFEPYGIPVSGRYSKALSKFYRLEKLSEEKGPTTYLQGLLDVVSKEKVDLWVSCSGVASAVEDGQAKELLERKSPCKCIQYDVETTAVLHEKDAFIRYTERLGLPTPETHEVRSRSAVHRILHDAQGKKKRYIMKTVGVDDASRGNIMTTLPRRTMSQTYQHVSDLNISKSSPWVLQEYIKGEEYCTHSIVVDGKVQLFVACPSSELLMHYKALPEDSGLSRSMLDFTKAFAERSGPGFTGHLSFDFMVQEKASERGLESLLRPIEANPRAHTAVVLFNGPKGSIDMTAAYFEALRPAANGTMVSTSSNGQEEDSGRVPYTQSSTGGFYWIGHDLVSLVLHPLLRLFMFQVSIDNFVKGLAEFVEHILLWRDGTYELWDPLPWFMLYHVYWPGQFAAALVTGKRWSRINVSTAKMFAC